MKRHNIICPKAHHDYSGVLKIMNGEYPTLTMINDMMKIKLNGEQSIMPPQEDEFIVKPYKRRKTHYSDRYVQTKLTQINIHQHGRYQRYQKNILTFLMKGIVTCIITIRYFFKNIIYNTMKIVYKFR
jgi:hypothetical protein